MVEAQTFLAGWLHEVGRDRARPPSVQTLLDAYTRERIQDKSARHTSIMRGHMPKFFGELPVDALTADKVRSYVVFRTDPDEDHKPAQTGTVRREIGVLIAAINHAKKQLRVDPAIVPYIELPEGSPARTETLTDGQLATLDGLVEPLEGERCSRICRFYWLAKETASRRRAVETLKWSQVDLAARLIHYNDDGSKKVRKIKRRVSVPISDALMPMLKRFHEERTGDFVLDDDGQAYVAWGWLIERASKATGDQTFLDKVPHDLRRTWATSAARAGVSMFDIAGILGDSLAVVIKHYAHHSPDHLRGAINYRATVQPASPVIEMPKSLDEEIERLTKLKLIRQLQQELGEAV